MVVNFKVFKKCAPNGKVTLYLGKRDFIDHLSSVEPIDGVIVLHDEYLRDRRKIFGQVVCSFRYGREEDEVMGLNFQKELYLASECVYPADEKAVKPPLTKLQERLMKKLGDNAFPFTFQIPPNAPASVSLQQKTQEGNEQPCGIQYFVKIFAGDSETDRTHRRSTVRKERHLRNRAVYDNNNIDPLLRSLWASARCSSRPLSRVRSRARWCARTLC